MNYRKILFLSACMLLVNAAFSQAFQEGFQNIAKGKPSYVTLMTGEKYSGYIKEFDWRKGLYEAITFMDSTGKEHQWKAADIKHIYAYPAGMEKLLKRADFITNVTKMTNYDYSLELLGKGMMLFEQTDVIIKKKPYNLLMQLLNPDFCRDIKVYRDPIVKEAGKWELGGMTLAGGEIMSYYVKKGNEPAFYLFKRTYKKEFKTIFGDNAEMVKKYADNPVWEDFAKHIVEYSQSKTN